ncbi:hypothetical protein [Streptomyces sp. NPDC090021]|uniref:hypothetical protein n=1 Tax=Streptomyces sp. NPDC090021 TaxID=3365919 RepID=UPI0038223B42
MRFTDRTAAHLSTRTHVQCPVAEFTGATAPTPGAGADRHPRAFVAPLVSTLLTLPMAAVAFFFVGLAPVACDSCGGAVSDRFDDSYHLAFPVFGIGMAVVLVLLLCARALPWRRGNAAARVWPAVIAPAAVVLDFIVFHGLVDWPWDGSGPDQALRSQPATSVAQ